MGNETFYGDDLNRQSWKLFLSATRRSTRSSDNAELVISRCCFAQRTAKKCTKSYNARTQPLFRSLNLSFSDVPVAFAVVVILNSLFSHPEDRHLDR